VEVDWRLSLLGNACSSTCKVSTPHHNPCLSSEIYYSLKLCSLVSWQRLCRRYVAFGEYGTGNLRRSLTSVLEEVLLVTSGASQHSSMSVSVGVLWVMSDFGNPLQSWPVAQLYADPCQHYDFGRTRSWRSPCNSE
jgi:hypothetical protein